MYATHVITYSRGHYIRAHVRRDGRTHVQIWRCLFCFLAKSWTKSVPRKGTPTFVIQNFQKTKKKTSAGGIWENKFGRPAGFGRPFFRSAGGIRKTIFGRIIMAGRRDSEDNFRAKRTKCGSNESSGHDDQFCPSFVKIGAILGYF